MPAIGRQREDIAGRAIDRHLRRDRANGRLACKINAARIVRRNLESLRRVALRHCFERVAPFEARILELHPQLALRRGVVPHELEARCLGHRIAGQPDRVAVERPVALGFLVDRAIGQCIAETAARLQLQPRRNLHLVRLVKARNAGRGSQSERHRSNHGHTRSLARQAPVLIPTAMSASLVARRNVDGDLNMSDKRPASDTDVTKDWRATQGQKSAATRLRIFAVIAWLIAIGTEIAGVVMLRQHKFDHGNMALLIGLLVVIAIFAIAGSLMWKAANRHDPARESDTVKFFVQNQLGAIITVIAFLPLIVLIFMDKDMDPKNKKIAGGVGVVLAAAATFIGIDFNPPSVEQYTQDMNKCAAEIKANQPTTDCSPEVAQQAQDIARDSQTVAEATKDSAHPTGLDVVYWIAPENGAKK